MAQCRALMAELISKNKNVKGKSDSEVEESVLSLLNS